MQIRTNEKVYMYACILNTNVSQKQTNELSHHLGSHISQRSRITRQMIQIVLRFIGVRNAFGQSEIEHFQLSLRVESDIVRFLIII